MACNYPTANVTKAHLERVLKLNHDEMCAYFEQTNPVLFREYIAKIVKEARGLGLYVLHPSVMIYRCLSLAVDDNPPNILRGIIDGQSEVFANMYELNPSKWMTEIQNSDFEIFSLIRGAMEGVIDEINEIKRQKGDDNPEYAQIKIGMVQAIGMAAFWIYNSFNLACLGEYGGITRTPH